MRFNIGLSLLVLSLAACAPKTQPNDGDQYFDRITPDPAALEGQAQESRLKQAENLPVTVRPPEETTLKTASSTPQKPLPVVKPEVKPEGDGSISTSQDFTAVKSRETIESDAAKLENLKSNYEIVKPGADPRRSGGVNLAKYALSQSNPVGNKIYSRFSIGGARYKNKCARFISDDEAQLAFLNAGGPQRDARGIDPDGDGYACGWSPSIYRSLIGQ